MLYFPRRFINSVCDICVPSFHILDEQPPDNLSEAPGDNADFYAVLAVFNPAITLWKNEQGRAGCVMGWLAQGKLCPSHCTQ